jgi:hypothetical protein
MMTVTLNSVQSSEGGKRSPLPRHAFAAYRAIYPGEEVNLVMAKWEEVEARFPEVFLGMCVRSGAESRWHHDVLSG